MLQHIQEHGLAGFNPVEAISSKPLIPLGYCVEFPLATVVYPFSVNDLSCPPSVRTTTLLLFRPVPRYSSCVFLPCSIDTSNCVLLHFSQWCLRFCFWNCSASWRLGGSGIAIAFCKLLTVKEHSFVPLDIPLCRHCHYNNNFCCSNAYLISNGQSSFFFLHLVTLFQLLIFAASPFNS